MKRREHNKDEETVDVAVSEVLEQKCVDLHQQSLPFAYLTNRYRYRSLIQKLARNSCPVPPIKIFTAARFSGQSVVRDEITGKEVSADRGGSD